MRREEHLDASIETETLLRRHGADGVSLAIVPDVDAARIDAALDEHRAHDPHATRRQGALLGLSLGGVTVEAYPEVRVGLKPRDESLDLVRAVREHLSALGDEVNVLRRHPRCPAGRACRSRGTSGPGRSQWARGTGGSGGTLKSSRSRCAWCSGRTSRTNGTGGAGRSRRGARADERPRRAGEILGARGAAGRPVCRGGGKEEVAATFPMKDF